MKYFIPTLTAILFNTSTLLAQTFTGSFDMITMHNYPHGNERIDTISYFFGSEKTALIIYGKRKDPDLRMVFSPGDSTITSLFEMNGRKGGFILPMDEKHWPGMKYALRPQGSGPNKTLRYTGKESVLEGFDCKEILADNGKYSARMMISEDVELSMTSIFSYQSVGAGKSEDESKMFDEFGVQDLVLELNLESKEEKGNVIIRLQNFKEDVPDKILSTEGYSLTKID